MSITSRPSQDTTRKRRLAVIALIFLVFAVWHIASPYGARRYYQISRELAAMQEENTRLQAENKQLRTEIHRLKNDPVFLEEVARQQHGLIKRNEILFDFSDGKKKKH